MANLFDWQTKILEVPSPPPNSISYHVPSDFLSKGGHQIAQKWLKGRTRKLCLAFRKTALDYEQP